MEPFTIENFRERATEAFEAAVEALTRALGPLSTASVASIEERERDREQFFIRAVVMRAISELSLTQCGPPAREWVEKTAQEMVAELQQTRAPLMKSPWDKK